VLLLFRTQGSRFPTQKDRVQAPGPGETFFLACCAPATRSRWTDVVALRCCCAGAYSHELPPKRSFNISIES
jgi:hypothetical protein